MLKATAAVVGSTNLSNVAVICEYTNVSAIIEESPNSSFDSSVSNPAPIFSVPSPSFVSSSDNDPVSVPHLIWPTLVSHTQTADPVPVEVMIDTGSFLLLIASDLVERCALKTSPLPSPIHTCSAFDKIPHTHTSYVCLKLHYPSFRWSAHSVKVLVVESLCHDVILSLPFSKRNYLVIDIEEHSVIDKSCGFDLLNPSPVPTPPQKPVPLKKLFQNVMSSHRAVINELNDVCTLIHQNVD
jgi:hypothetical protein